MLANKFQKFVKMEKENSPGVFVNWEYPLGVLGNWMWTSQFYILLYFWNS